MMVAAVYCAAIFVFQVLIFLRLGELIDILKKKRNEPRSCVTCINSDVPAFDEPCKSCIQLESKPYWKDAEG